MTYNDETRRARAKLTWLSALLISFNLYGDALISDFLRLQQNTGSAIVSALTLLVLAQLLIFTYQALVSLNENPPNELVKRLGKFALEQPLYGSWVQFALRKSRDEVFDPRFQVPHLRADNIDHFCLSYYEYTGFLPELDNQGDEILNKISKNDAEWLLLFSQMYFLEEDFKQIILQRVDLRKDKKISAFFRYCIRRFEPPRARTTALTSISYVGRDITLELILPMTFAITALIQPFEQIKL